MISGCPNDIGVSVTPGTTSTIVSWPEPTAIDATNPANQLIMVATQSVPASLTVGVNTTVRYLWQDTTTNDIAECIFYVNVRGEILRNP